MSAGADAPAVARVPGPIQRVGTSPWRTAALAGALALAAILPLIGLSDYYASTLTRALAFALLVVSLDLIAGLAGLPSLGQAAFFGIGVYAAALVGQHVTASALVQLLAATAAAGLIAGVAGSVAVRARGTYFLMLTLALGEIIQQILFSWESVTGGSNGLVGGPLPTLLPNAVPLETPESIYWYALAVFAVGFAGIAAIARSPFGRTLRGIRDNEERMRALGYRTTWAKHLAFAFSGAFAGAAGSLWLAQKGFAYPGDAGFELAALALLAVVIGGAGSLWGPAVAGAAVLIIYDNVFFGNGLLILGLFFIAAVYLFPGGLSSVANRLWIRHARSTARSP
jgi:branched-chain amino acid transport system permease protein